ncbi:hypothetical protein WA026_019080 [Henosepilachna vigintioctopunctata]|uniref:Uncharacterized protein n=1 Tax=Henosepilachna vigintioctopunctata TaxID=420089 RepID=A0AAW1VEZ8_9CUCU
MVNKLDRGAPFRPKARSNAIMWGVLIPRSQYVTICTTLAIVRPRGLLISRFRAQRIRYSSSRLDFGEGGGLFVLTQRLTRYLNRVVFERDSQLSKDIYGCKMFSSLHIKP